MLDSTITMPLFSVPTFRLVLALAIAVSAGIGARRTMFRPARLIDAALGALAGAVAGGRIGHVALNWAYFSENLSEALHPELGGLDWHGAVIGGLIGLALVARWRKLNMPSLLDALAPTLPLLAFAGWLGCAAAVCGYGAEVDTLAHYPPLVAAESRDVYGIVAPRYSTQAFGMALALGLVLVSALAHRLETLRGRRFWCLLALFSMGMFAIGFYRGDSVPMLLNLRADQWLDVGIFGGSAIGFIRRPKPTS